MSDLTPQQHYQEAERLMAEADRAAESDSPFESQALAQAASARALIAIAAAVSDVARALAGQPSGGL